MAATVWKGYLSFGLVSFPVRLFAAARPERIQFHMLHEKDLSRIKEVWYCAEEDKPIEHDEIVKGYEYEKGQYIVITDEELKAIAPTTATTMEILQFVKSGEVDPIYLESSYYMAPEEAANKPYVLLRDAMQQTKYYAIAKVAMHNREHVVIIRPADKGLVLHTMYYNDELHESNAPKQSSKAAYGAKEIDLAKTLINTLAGTFTPEQFHDQYRENVEKMLDQKRKGNRVTPIRQPSKKAPVVDILSALQRSLEQSKKPAGKTRTAQAKSKAKKGRHAA